MPRKHIIGISAGIIAVAAVVLLVFSWLYAPYVKARLLLGTLDYHRGRIDDALGPSMCGLEYWDFSLNTYTDGIDTWCITSLYNTTCKHFQTQFGASALVTYTYQDQEGWPRQVTVVRLREDLESRSYLAVSALQNNDNDMVRFTHHEGIFDTANKKNISSWKLLPDILRR